jgi:endonuclease-3
MKTKKDAKQIVKILKEYYKDAKCSLDFKNPFEMAISVMLSAQCTDERVNKTTPILFSKYGTPQKMATAEIGDLEEIIHPCGFYKNKAKNMKACSQKLVEDFDGIVPEDMELLQNLPGIGRKSANVIMLEAFHNPQGIAVDTHAKRISNKMGFSAKEEPEKIEQDLLKVIPKEYYYDVNHLFVWHGRKICTARSPKCEICPVKEYCNYYLNKKN